MKIPCSFLARFCAGAVLDEVPRYPEILSCLQTLMDKDRRMGLFILTEPPRKQKHILKIYRYSPVKEIKQN